MPRAYNGKQNREKMRTAGELASFLPITASFRLAEAAQVDFGAGPVLPHESGAQIKTWFFVMTLCWSRHQYVELVLDQTVETWLACHRRAFEWFGGCPGRIIIDFVACNKIVVLCPWPLCSETRGLSSLEAVDRECVNT